MSRQIGQIAAGCKSGRARGYIEEYRPYAKTRALFDQVQVVLDEYREYWPLTCRQIFYRMVGAHGYDKSESAYGRLCNHLANARRARVIPFYAIRDDFLRHVRSMASDTPATSWQAKSFISRSGARRRACCLRSTM